MLRNTVLLLAFCTLASCAQIGSFFQTSPAPERMNLEQVDYSDIPGWKTDNHVEAFNAFLRSCGDFLSRQDGEATGKNELLAPMVVWKDICRKALRMPYNDEMSVRKFFEDQFVPMKASTDDSEYARLTGYYEPLLSGSRMQGQPYVYPVYGLPQYGSTYTRDQIDLGYIRSQAPVIAYVDDPIQLFFMHIQGSGSIRMENGEIVHVGYAGNNGHPYVAIGKVLVERGALKKEEVSMQTIRQWLYDHPQQMWQTMWENPTYIFFQEMDGGPFGSEKVQLTPGRSLAVDKNYIPLGMPVFVDTVMPGTAETSFTISRRLMVAQDTGRAIQGPLRGDIFFGGGFAAEDNAGRMNAGGTLTLLVPKIIINPPADTANEPEGVIGIIKKQWDDLEH